MINDKTFDPEQDKLQKEILENWEIINQLVKAEEEESKSVVDNNYSQYNLE